MRIRWLGGAALLAVACDLNETPPNRVSFQVDDVLLQMSRVLIQRLDALDNPVYTLFNDSLRAVQQVQNLEAPGYNGEPAKFSIQGFRRTDLAYHIVVGYNGSTVTGVEKKAVYTFSLINQKFLSLLRSRRS